MSMSLMPQIQTSTQSPSVQNPASEYHLLPLAFKPVVPTKRSDDDIQFISSQPVKRQKMSQQSPKPTAQQHNVVTMPAMPPVAIPPVALAPPEFRDTDRRISTGMVGLPSDFSAVELASALRGVSLPVLERFSLNQPSRKPRPPSPPELSPRQLPQTVVPAMLSAGARGKSTEDSCCTAPVAYMKNSEHSSKSEAPPNPLNSASTPSELRVLNTPVTHVSPMPPVLGESPRYTEPKPVVMPPPPLPRVDITGSSESPLNNPLNSNRLDTTKQPCQICARMRQQANIAKAQGLPVLHHNIGHHMLPQMACHPPYGQHLHPQMIPMGPNGIHPFGPGFAPLMMPINNGNYIAPPSHAAGPTQMKQKANGTNSQSNYENTNDQPQLPPTPTAEGVEASTPANPTKPRAFPNQPTYRKPSPNLIVDVAETCQEKFPFEEVANRHNVPIEKVFDVFAAIIQVPLLRCPTDRRRAGKLATTRVKEYAKAKKAIQEVSGQNSSDPKEIAVRPLDVANHLGRIDLPDGFILGEWQ